MTGKRMNELISKATLTLDDCQEIMDACDGYLDLRCNTLLTSLPDNLTVGGALDLEGCTSLTSLPDNLTVGGALDLTGCTSLTSLPDNLTVGGWLGFSGCPIQDTSSVKRLRNGAYVEGRYLYADFILTHIKSKRTVGKYTIYYGKIKGYNVVYDGKYYAHCDNIRDGIKDIEFKYAKNRGCEQYRELSLDSIVTKDEAIMMYRVITGACQQGTEMFINSLGDNIKENYTIDEIIKLTSGQYGSDVFKEFFIDMEEIE